MSLRPSCDGQDDRAVQKFCDFDDVCTDLLVDKVGFWVQTHKMARGYKSKRTVSEEDVLQVIRRMVGEEQSLREGALEVMKYGAVVGGG
jgi:hypothetical protein